MQDERAFLWQCDGLQLATNAGYRGMRRLTADVIMGSSEPMPHMLTIDYLRDMSPCVFWKMKTLEVPRGVRHAWVWTQFKTQPLELHAGAPIVTVHVDGKAYRLILDTGAPFACMLFRSPPTKAKAHNHVYDARGKGMTTASLQQTVQIGKRSFLAPVLYSPGSGPDGLLGLQILKQLDVYLGTDVVGFA